MKQLRILLPALLLTIIPTIVMAKMPQRINLSFELQLIAFFNLLLLVTSIVSIKQFFWHGDHNHSPFQLFNLLFTVIFYAISLRFLVVHKDYFDGYENLSAWQCIQKHFTATEFYSILKRLIVVAFVLNIIYLIRNGKDYYIDR